MCVGVYDYVCIHVRGRVCGSARGRMWVDVCVGV